jgi:hypothetical protein
MKGVGRGEEGKRGGRVGCREERQTLGVGSNGSLTHWDSFQASKAI